ncbi:hypothetical protein NQ318_013481 [Aromia moschata]|uniref:Uncharacterized protein n=1 Tax=Aromia moschata TaxID=1265417 RepID=A0AAV8YC46_9CUCU|nr:hypothetical protein NQ318_013481 [Aromia moschata]
MKLCYGVGDIWKKIAHPEKFFNEFKGTFRLQCSSQKKKTGDYHEERRCFRKVVSSILRNLEPGSVDAAGMDNAPYHSRRLEALPTTAWRKGQIVYRPKNKNFLFKDNQLKLQLLEIARLHKEKYVKYAVDETATVHGITVIRLPPNI